MEYRIKQYAIRVGATGSTPYLRIYVALPTGLTLPTNSAELSRYVHESVRVIIDEAISHIVGASLSKFNIGNSIKTTELTGYDLRIDINLPDGSVYDSSLNAIRFTKLIKQVPTVLTIQETDEFTIKADWGDAFSDISNTIKTDASANKQDVLNAIDLAKRAIIGGDQSTSLAALLTAISSITGYATENSLSQLASQIGTDTTTVHAKLTAIAAASSALSTMLETTAPYAKEATLGTSADGSSAGTIFGKLANILTILSSAAADLGSDSNHVSAHTKLDLLLTALGECYFERNNDGADTWTLVLDRLSSVNNNILDV